MLLHTSGEERCVTAAKDSTATQARYSFSKSRNFTDVFTGEAQLAPTTQTSVNFRDFEALYQTLYQTWQFCQRLGSLSSGVDRFSLTGTR